MTSLLTKALKALLVAAALMIGGGAIAGDASAKIVNGVYEGGAKRVDIRRRGYHGYRGYRRHRGYRGYRRYHYKPYYYKRHYYYKPRYYKHYYYKKKYCFKWYYGKCVKWGYYY